MQTALTIYLALTNPAKLDFNPLTYVMGFTKPAKKPNEIGIASRFGDPGDNQVGDELFCTPGKKMAENVNICAHRNLPCGTILFLENPRNHMRSVCVVSDRGPYGSVNKEGEWDIKINADDPGEWRGVLDMSPATSRDLGHNGFEKINIWYHKIPIKNKQ